MTTPGGQDRADESAEDLWELTQTGVFDVEDWAAVRKATKKTRQEQGQGLRDLFDDDPDQYDENGEYDGPGSYRHDDDDDDDNDDGYELDLDGWVNARLEPIPTPRAVLGWDRPLKARERSSRSEVASVAAAAALGLACLAVAKSIDAGWSEVWTVVAALLAAAMATYVVAAATPATAKVERKLMALRPGAVALARGEGYATFGPQGIDLWSIRPLRLSRAIAWPEVVDFEVGWTSRSRRFERSWAAASPGGGQSRPAVRVRLSDGRSGELVIDPISGATPAEAAAAVEGQARRARAAASSAVVELTASGRDRRASSGRRRVLADRWFCPTAGVVRWLGAGVATALTGLAMALLSDGESDWSALLAILAALALGAAMGAFTHLRPSKLKTIWGLALRIGLAAALALGATVVVFDGALLLARGAGWTTAPTIFNWPVATSAATGSSPSQPAAFGEFDPEADIEDWAGRRMPAADPATADGFLEAVRQSVGIVILEHPTAATALTGLADCPAARPAGGDPADSSDFCSTVSLVEGADSELAVGIAAVAGGGFEAFTFSVETAQAPDAAFSPDQIDPQVAAGLIGLCAVVGVGPEQTRLDVSRNPWVDPPTTLVYEASCLSGGRTHIFEADSLGTITWAGVLQ
ncbi:MAG: hypothetical protein LBG60_11360 [Bifidobacteriaceae bacterium]|jgi:hypothetical protein|nr:hypothetical protein [Bifidobacteriaceae bacterium]